VRLVGAQASEWVRTLVLLSIILTVSVLFPEAPNETVILAILFGGGSLGILIALGALLAKRPGRNASSSDGGALSKIRAIEQQSWRMPPLSHLPPLHLSVAVKIWMFALRAYLVLAAGLILIRIAALAAGLT
jgi:hypothetical protein